MENFNNLILELCKLPNETTWLEFKHNNYDPNMIGKDISALANSAAIEDKDCAYMFWGIDDKSHEIVGTNNNLQTLKKGNEELENWLRRLLSKNANFHFHSTMISGKNVSILVIYKAINQTVTFEKIDYIRIGSYTKKLNEFPVLQSQLWDKIRNSKFEEHSAMQDLSLKDALSMLDYSKYFDLLNIPQPTDIKGICHHMLEEKIIIQQDNGLFTITNLGAILFSKKISIFPTLSRKALRIIQYRGNNRLEMLRNDTFNYGYVISFERIVTQIDALIPTQQLITKALRQKKSAYPILAIREAVANSLIHQDFSVSGTSPMIELFENRIEITNPGTPLVDVKRFIDNPPRSRNEKLASLMRRLGICEESGTGWDKIVISCELLQLPAPKVDLYEDSIKVSLFTETPFSDLSSEDKIRACYLHACVKYVQREYLTNSTLRERFGLKESSSGSVSRLIKETIGLSLIKPLDATTAPRYMKYIPFWA